MVLSKYFFIVVPFVALILFPKTRYFWSLWGPLGVILATFGSILVALGSSGVPRGTPCTQKLFLMDLRRFCPPLWGPNFDTFSIIFPKVKLQKRSFVRLVVNTHFFYKIDDK